MQHHAIPISHAIAGTYRNQLYARFAGQGVAVSCKKNDPIELGGDRQSCVYLVKKGIVKQDFILENGSILTALILSRGDLCGEVTYMHGDQNPISSIAHNDVELEQIPIARFAAILEEQPEIHKYVSYMLAYKVRSLLALLHDTSFCRVEHRLYNLLQRLAHQFGDRKSVV